MNLKHIFAFGSLLLAAVAGAQAAESNPNILVILADDLGYGDVQCYNPQRGKIATPHIDKLATQGMRFTDAHSSSGVCSPSRYTLLTGRYHWRTRLQSGIVGVFGEPLIAPDRMTIGTLAKQQGYHTATIGKWHLGWDWPIAPEQRKLLQASKKAGKDDEAKPTDDAAVATAEQQIAWRDIFSKPIAGGPTTRGFDSYFGTDVPNWPPYCFIENDRTIGIPSEFLPAVNFRNNLASLPGPALKEWNLEAILPTLGDRATAFVIEAAKKPEPFLLYLPLTAPHTPLAVNAEWRDKSKLNTYADFVMETDATVGRVLDALEKSGAADHTLVIFTSDNGCAPYIGASELEKMGHYPSGPLRGYKSDAWEGGHRVPFIVRWPGVVQPGTNCGQIVLQADLLATIADILHAKLPDTAGEDSFSLLPLFRGEDKPVRDQSVNCSASGLPSVRSGSWKLILGPGSGGWGKGGDQSWPVQLYNLAEDLGETRNLAAAQPERVEQMKALLDKLITDGRSTPGAPQKNDVQVKRYPAKAAAPKKETNVPKRPFAMQTSSPPLAPDRPTAPTSQPAKLPEGPRTHVATIFGTMVYLDQIEPFKGWLAKGEKPTQEKLTELRGQRLLDVISGRAVEDYVRREKLGISDEWKKKLWEVIQSAELPDTPPSTFTKEQRRQVAYAWQLGSLKDWIICKSLYERYGGRVGFGSLGLWIAVDGRNQLMREYLDQQRIQIHDPELEKAFWKAANKPNFADAYPTGDRLKQLMAYPPHLIPARRQSEATEQVKPPQETPLPERTDTVAPSDKANWN